jgi:hypothetical protein
MSSNAMHRGPQRGTIEEAGWRPACNQIQPDVALMDAILYGVEWILIRDPQVGEIVGQLPNGATLRAFVSTPQDAAPVSLVVFYWDDGERLHLEYLERGD